MSTTTFLTAMASVDAFGCDIKNVFGAILAVFVVACGASLFAASLPAAGVAASGVGLVLGSVAIVVGVIEFGRQVGTCLNTIVTAIAADVASIKSGFIESLPAPSIPIHP